MTSGRKTSAAALALSLSLAAALSGWWRPASALESDREASTQIESDRMEYDDQQQVNVFSGNVVLTKGTIRLSAARLLVRQDTQGFHHASATGAPARFRQKRDGPGDQWIAGEALRIDYDGKAQTVRLRDAAVLQRTSNGRSIDEIHGNDIRYDSRTGFFTVQASRTDGAAGGTPENPAGRVRVIIQPRDGKNGAGAAGAVRPDESSDAAGQTSAAPPANAVPLAPDERLRVRPNP